MDETTSQSELDQALKELQELKAHAKSLSERNSQLREANTLAPRRIALLEEKLKETKSLLSKAASENQNLVNLLQETRSQWGDDPSTAERRWVPSCPGRHLLPRYRTQDS